MAKRNHIKCNFCDHRVVLFRRRRDGSMSGPDRAFAQLWDHIENDHPEEAGWIQRWVERSSHPIPVLLLVELGLCEEEPMVYH